MKAPVLVIFVVIRLLVCSQEAYVDSLERKREEHSVMLLETDQLLNEKEQRGIVRLDYFPVDTTWRIEGKLIKDKGKKFEMPTSTERKPIYRRYGWVCLRHDGREFRLAVYENLDLKGKEYKDYLFLPFKDAGAPLTTYGGGRYIELYKPKTTKSTTIIVDFNTAFNPYCVYSHRFSCPITPEINHLDFKIPAGEKNPIFLKTDGQ
ncbi:MAG: DUF1684 domain-containing protein [Brumimicrobium sp.]|nr:DUF1684 domain-containing protein [Brumimicrobium sp.]